MIRLNDKQVEALLAACREVADGQLRRPVPHRRVSDRLGHVEQHERQRGDRQSGHRTGRRRPLQPRKADPSQRPRQHGPKHQRHLPHGHPRGRGPGDPRRFDAGLDPLRIGVGRESARSGTRSSRSAARTWPTPRRCAWARRSADSPGSWSFRSPGRQRPSKRSSNCPPAARPWARASTRIPSSATAWPKCWPRGPAFRSSRRPITSRPTPSATAWSNVTANCGPSP